MTSHEFQVASAQNSPSLLKNPEVCVNPDYTKQLNEIINLRTKAGLSKAQTARGSNIAVSSYGFKENGKRFFKPKELASVKEFLENYLKDVEASKYPSLSSVLKTWAGRLEPDPSYKNAIIQVTNTGTPLPSWYLEFLEGLGINIGLPNTTSYYVIEEGTYKFKQILKPTTPYNLGNGYTLNGLASLIEFKGTPLQRWHDFSGRVRNKDVFPKTTNYVAFKSQTLTSVEYALVKNKYDLELNPVHKDGYWVVGCFDGKLEYVQDLEGRTDVTLVPIDLLLENLLK